MNDSSTKIQQTADMIAYLDEAGEKGLLQNLTESRDSFIGLISALVFPVKNLASCREEFRPGYDRFCSAAPPGEKIHITDAFKSGNEAWAEVAKEVRGEFSTLIQKLEIPIIYNARRLNIQRKTFEQGKELIKEAKERADAGHKLRIKVSDADRKCRIEEGHMIGLVLKIDVFAEDYGYKHVDFYFDEIDAKMVKLFRATIIRTQSISKNEKIVKRWDCIKEQPVHGKIEFEGQSPFSLDVRFIGEIKVIGKNDPLILATDIIANSLFHHLKNLAPEAPLNALSSISEFQLRDRIYGVRENALEDLI